MYVDKNIWTCLGQILTSWLLFHLRHVVWLMGVISTENCNECPASENMCFWDWPKHAKNGLVYFNVDITPMDCPSKSIMKTLYPPWLNLVVHQWLFCPTKVSHLLGKMNKFSKVSYLLPSKRWLRTIISHRKVWTKWRKLFATSLSQPQQIL